MRRFPVVVLTAVVLTLPSVSSVGAASSPYPATLKLQRGLTMSRAVRALPWGTTLTTAQARWVTLRSPTSTVEWGVWRQDGASPEFPVRSLDGGAHWTTAGPLLATDWAGGGIFYPTRVISEGSSAAVFVSGAVIDLTVDAGHHWYQYVNGADNWSITKHAVAGGVISLRVSPATYASLPKASYAIYVLDLAQLQWRRVAQSLS